MKKPEVIVERSKWRFGGRNLNDRISIDNVNLVEIFGHTKLSNYEGYRCCLGFACQQLAPSLTDADILNKFYPNALTIYFDKEKIKNLYGLMFREGIVHEDLVEYPWVRQAAKINDSSLSFKERECKLIDLFAENGINLSFAGEYTQQQKEVFGELNGK